MHLGNRQGGARMIDLSTRLTVVALAAGLGLNLLLLVGYLLERRASARRAVELDLQSRRIEMLERDFAAILACSRRVGDRLSEAEQTLRVQGRALDSRRTTDEGQLDIPQAMKLLANGIALDDVTRLCELSEGERELLSNMARHRRAA
jgi:Protein of unknown function (DUF2802)